MIIDTDNYEKAGIEVFQFPGGEWHANVPPMYGRSGGSLHVFAKFRTWDDVGKFIVVADALKTQGVRIYLFAPYFPGLRQDRNPGGNTPLTCRIYGNLLNEFASHITVVDAHSEVGLIEAGKNHRITNIEPQRFVGDLIEDAPTHIVIPDKGAKDRSIAVGRLFPEVMMCQAEKTRDFETGKLSGFTVPPMGSAERILIADDICDGGGTFVGLLEKIRETSSAPVDLYVTHGIFSKGLQVLEGFDNIYTTDSFYQYGPPEQHGDPCPRVIELLPYYLGGLRP
jgi:ribose-phosphate pyrophosphokinase